MLEHAVTFIGCDADYDQADTVLFGAPFDGTTSFRPGTRFAPQAMRNESDGIETYSPYQDKDLTACAIHDGGDLLLPFGDPSETLARIESQTEDILLAGKRPFMIGGEHLVTLGAMRAVVRTYPQVHIIQFDAHADLRDDYLGQRLSHATVLRRVWDLLGDGRLHQLGIRSGEQSEFAFAKTHSQLFPFTLEGVHSVREAVGDAPVYITVDLDVLDPSLFAGTGTPEAGGVFFPALLEALLALRGLDVVGCDINELSPHYDHSGVSTAVACKVLREMLLAYC